MYRDGLLSNVGDLLMFRLLLLLLLRLEVLVVLRRQVVVRKRRGRLQDGLRLPGQRRGGLDRRWRVLLLATNVARRCALLDALLYRTQLLLFFLVIVAAVLRLLRHAQVVRMVLAYAALAPVLWGRVIHQGACVVYLRDWKYRPLILPQNQRRLDTRI